MKEKKEKEPWGIQYDEKAPLGTEVILADLWRFTPGQVYEIGENIPKQIPLRVAKSAIESGVYLPVWDAPAAPKAKPALDVAVPTAD